MVARIVGHSGGGRKGQVGPRSHDKIGKRVVFIDVGRR